MIDFDFDKYCSGCAACYSVCTTNAIEMTENQEGFLMPKVSLDKCISCGKCDKVCPHLNNKKKNNGCIEGAWLYCSDNNSAKMNSASGAAGYELMSAMLNSDGYICGCVWDSNLNAKHIVGSTENVLHKIQGSKYVQSDINDTYKKIVELLEDGKKVVFTGTPCQATAIHNIVSNVSGGKYRNSLLTVAVICHGVASPMVWNSFKKWTSNNHGSELVGVNFRDKSKEGYRKSYCKYDYKDGTSIYLPTFLPSSKYIEATLVYNLALRKSCEHCDAKGINTGIDLIIGDWYAEYKGEGSLGTSCIVAFTERGRIYVTKNLSGLREVDYDVILEKNNFIRDSVKFPVNRNKFMHNIINDTEYWNYVEKMYPRKYKLKKLLVRTGMYDIIKKISG